MLGILRDQTVGRTDLHDKVITLMVELVKNTKMPEKLVNYDDMSVDSKE